MFAVISTHHLNISVCALSTTSSVAAGSKWRLAYVALVSHVHYPVLVYCGHVMLFV